MDYTHHIQSLCTHLCDGKDVRYLIRGYERIYKRCPICHLEEYASKEDLKKYKFLKDMKTNIG